MPEEIAATPGWTDDRLDVVFAELPAGPEMTRARDAYEACLAARKSPSSPSDMLGAEFAPCRPPLHEALREAGLDAAALERVNQRLEAIEAEIAADS